MKVVFKPLIFNLRHPLHKGDPRLMESLKRGGWIP